MPLLLACVEAVNKMVGGFFLLIAMMWRDSKRPTPPPPKMNQPSLGYGDDGQGYPRRDFAYRALTEDVSAYPRRRENTQRPHYYQSM